MCAIFCSHSYLLPHHVSKVEKFEDLIVWQKGLSQAIDLYGRLTNCSDYGLRDQMQRAAVSVPSNIAEGFEGESNKEFIRYLKFLKGSAGELHTQLYIAANIGLINSRQRKNFLLRAAIAHPSFANLSRHGKNVFKRLAACSGRPCPCSFRPSTSLSPRQNSSTSLSPKFS